MDNQEDAYTNRATLFTNKQYFGYPATPVICLLLMSVLTGVQLHSFVLFIIVLGFGFVILNFVCHGDPNGLAVWIYVMQKRLLKRISCLSPATVQRRKFFFTD